MLWGYVNSYIQIQNFCIILANWTSQTLDDHSIGQQDGYNIMWDPEQELLGWAASRFLTLWNWDKQLVVVLNSYVLE